MLPFEGGVKMQIDLRTVVPKEKVREIVDRVQTLLELADLRYVEVLIKASPHLDADMGFAQHMADKAHNSAALPTSQSPSGEPATVKK